MWMGWRQAYSLRAAAVWAALVLVMAGAAVPRAWAAVPEGGVQGRLVSVGWLQAQLAQQPPGAHTLRVLDASPAPQHRQGHIPGAVNADLFSVGLREVDLPRMQRRLRGWGLSPGQRIVIVDAGGTYMAPRLFWELLHFGVPAEQLFILDGGMARWRAAGGAVTTEATPPPPAGTVAVSRADDTVRVRLPEFLAATADPRAHVLLEALDPEYYFGATGFFNRPGHVSHATLMPADDFFNSDKTFKSPQQLQAMLQHLGVQPSQEVLTYCGGGGAAAVPFFALKFMLGYPRVRLFQESQLGWLQDERQLPVWTYAAPQLLRDTDWVKAFASPMLRGFGLSAVTVLDLRPPVAFAQGHVPQALNLPAAAWQAALHDSAALRLQLAQAGLDPQHEAVLVHEGGIDETSALALLLLHRAGQRQVSIYRDSIDRWTERGLQVATGAAPAPRGAAREWQAAPRLGVLAVQPPHLQTAAAGSPQPRVFIASGPRLPAQLPPASAGRVLHLPYAQFLQPGGVPRPAADIWKLLDKSGVPRYAPIVLLGETAGEAAVNYVVLRLMGFADVSVWAP